MANFDALLNLHTQLLRQQQWRESLFVLHGILKLPKLTAAQSFTAKHACFLVKLQALAPKAVEKTSQAFRATATEAQRFCLSSDRADAATALSLDAVNVFWNCGEADLATQYAKATRGAFESKRDRLNALFFALVGVHLDLLRGQAAQAAVDESFLMVAELKNDKSQQSQQSALLELLDVYQTVLHMSYMHRVGNFSGGTSRLDALKAAVPVLTKLLDSNSSARLKKNQPVYEV